MMGLIWRKTIERYVLFEKLVSIRLGDKKKKSPF